MQSCAVAPSDFSFIILLFLFCLHFGNYVPPGDCGIFSCADKKDFPVLSGTLAGDVWKCTVLKKGCWPFCGLPVREWSQPVFSSRMWGRGSEGQGTVTFWIIPEVRGWIQRNIKECEWVTSLADSGFITKLWNLGMGKKPYWIKSFYPSLQPTSAGLFPTLFSPS